MNGIDDPKNIVGMGSLLANDDEDLDIEDIERFITTGVSKGKKDKDVDFVETYSKEIENLGRRFGMNGQPAKLGGNSRPANRAKPSNNGLSDIDEIIKTAKPAREYMPPAKEYSTSQREYMPPSITSDYHTSRSTDEDDDEESEKAKSPMDEVDSSDDRESTARSDIDYYPVFPKSQRRNIDDQQLNRMTEEEIKRDHVAKAFGRPEKSDDDEVFQEEDDEDEMAKVLEQIDLLRSNLEAEGVDLSRIAEVDGNTSKKEARSILKILQIKNDRMRYCDFFEEIVLAAAYGLEGIFNGQREILGSKIDLTGYSDTVKVKLRRMRYDTSRFVSEIMKDYDIGPGWRIALEIVPSLFLYSRDRAARSSDSLVSDDKFKKAVNDLQTGSASVSMS